MAPRRLKLTLWLLLCSSLSFVLLAQYDFNSTAFVGSLNRLKEAAGGGEPPPFSPTNIAGYPCYAWWVGDATTNNGGTTVTNWNDWSGNGLNLTNSSGSYVPVPVANGLNSHRTIKLHVQFLYSGQYTSPQPHTIVVVLKPNPVAGNTTHYLFAGGISTGWSEFLQWYRRTNVNINAGSALSGKNCIPINTWSVVQAEFNGASSALYTNNVLCLSGNAGTRTFSGFCLNSMQNNATYSGSNEVAEICTYRTNLSEAARTNLYNYFKDKYGL